jgi:hypothetical protein
MRGEQMTFKPLAIGEIFGGAEEKEQGWDEVDSETDSEPLVNKRRMNPSSSNSMQLHGQVDNIIEKRKKKNEFFQGKSSIPQSNLFESDFHECAMSDPLQDQGP